MTRWKKVPAPKQTIVVSSNRPKITISERDGLVRLVIPSVNRRALALAHAIVCAYLCDISDEENLTTHEPTIAPGDAALTCLVITIELQRFGPVNVVRNASLRRTQIAFVSEALREAARRACSPAGSVPLYDILTVIA